MGAGRRSERRGTDHSGDVDEGRERPGHPRIRSTVPVAIEAGTPGNCKVIAIQVRELSRSGHLLVLRTEIARTRGEAVPLEGSAPLPACLWLVSEMLESLPEMKRLGIGRRRFGRTTSCIEVFSDRVASTKGVNPFATLATLKEGSAAGSYGSLTFTCIPLSKKPNALSYPCNPAH